MDLEELLALSGFSSIEQYLAALEAGQVPPELRAEVAELTNTANSGAGRQVAQLLAATVILGLLSTQPQRLRSRPYYSLLNQRYYLNGGELNDRRMRRIIRTDQEATALKLRRLAQQFDAGQIGFDQFSQGMANGVVGGHLRMMQLGAGARQRVTQKQLGLLSQRMLGMTTTGGNPIGELDALSRYLNLARTGQLTGAGLINRAGQYGYNIRPSYEEARTVALENAGYVAKRFLDPAAIHCQECPDYETLEWTPVEDVVPVGVACSCRGRCRCLRVVARIQDIGTFNIANFSEAIS